MAKDEEGELKKMARSARKAGPNDRVVEIRKPLGLILEEDERGSGGQRGAQQEDRRGGQDRDDLGDLRRRALEHPRRGPQLHHEGHPGAGRPAGEAGAGVHGGDWRQGLGRRQPGPGQAREGGEREAETGSSSKRT
eukprot:CAMPEP_0206414970 /NCGR_PEP_ID=MMETSP0294-20121207/35745_1 /ASSEMBLY_ACC=CAM_ASM_000327 /TAXON_ID=39354 /ORGANISM="Heterosigma akashiwo, Strain CCMP2393" /LENGTH=135 /DNA_ID=CAMNT_0053877089 /DNA_START=166 /DNA_END=573 /DNA_ORIENTATION=-